MNIGRESNWRRPNTEYHKALAPFFIPMDVARSVQQGGSAPS